MTVLSGGYLPITVQLQSVQQLFHRSRNYIRWKNLAKPTKTWWQNISEMWKFEGCVCEDLKFRPKYFIDLVLLYLYLLLFLLLVLHVFLF